MKTRLTDEFVLFGASGDLARNKLIPALFTVFSTGKRAHFIGFGRTILTTESFRDIVRTSVLADRPDADLHTLEKFVASWDYRSGGYDIKGLAGLPKAGKNTFRYYYLSIPSDTSLIRNICDGLKLHGHITRHSVIVLEKPFGTDFTSAEALNRILLDHFAEKQLYRIDHYLARDLVQDLLALRFANPIFEHIWNGKYIESISIEIKEEEGIRSRGQYYDRSGAIRDMIQNHALQLLAFSVMRQPKDLTPESIHREKIRVMERIRLFETAAEPAIRVGQYKGYTDELHVAKDSLTETSASLQVEIDLPKWRGVPIRILTGKKLNEKTTDIIVEFRNVGHSLWAKDGCTIMNNQIRINVQPRNEISLRVNSEFDSKLKCAYPTELRFGFADNAFILNKPYENALRDLFERDRSMYIGSKEILAAWRFIDGVIKKIDENRAGVLERY